MYQYKCPQCGNNIMSQQPLYSVNCNSCGCNFSAQQPPYQQHQRGVFDDGPSGKSRGLAGLFAILLGSLGIHYFYIGKTTAGIVFLVLGLLSCGFLGIVTLIQGIIMLTQTEEEFERKYVNSPSSIPLF